MTKPPRRAGASGRSFKTEQRTSECINWESPACAGELLRKEVIQPHLPVRLPCYDFTPIADPTFDSSFPEGLGHWLRALPTFVV